MWLVTQAIMGQSMLVNTDNVALLMAHMNETTKVILRDGSEQVIDMPFTDVAMKLQKHAPGGLI